MNGPKVRRRAESFADHYSQARQFYISQTPVEQEHIASAFTFELSKVKTPAIRARMVSHLLNVDETLGKSVAEALAIQELPPPADAARTTRTDLAKSPALSILANGPKDFKGRKIGVVISDGVDARLLSSLMDAVAKEGATAELIAPAVGGVKANDGSLIGADEELGGAPSVLYDAVVLFVTQAGVAQLANEAAMRDFINDAFAHLKVIGYIDSSKPLFERAGLPGDRDEGFVQIDEKDGVARFLSACRQLRIWSRGGKVKIAALKA